MYGNAHVLRLLSAAREAARDSEETLEARLQHLLIAVDMAVVHLRLSPGGVPDVGPAEDESEGEDKRPTKPEGGPLDCSGSSCARAYNLN